MSWEWRGNQLYDPDAQQTLLRDVTFWNCTDQSKATMAAAPDLLAALQQVVRVLDSAQMNGVWGFLYAHGFQWSGETADMNAARDAIAKATTPSAGERSKGLT